LQPLTLESSTDQREGLLQVTEASSKMTGTPEEYRVPVTRFHDWWYIVPTLDTISECRRFSEVEETVRVAISAALDVDINALAIAIELQPAWAGALREGA